MVLPYDVAGPAPLTAIWAIHEEAPNSPWRTIVAHWNNIDYLKEKTQVSAGNHPKPDFMGDVVDPRAGVPFPKNMIPNATVEGRLLETNFQKSPFLQSSEFTNDKVTFMIDSDAKTGDRPNYGQGQRAFLCGFASHTPPSGKGGELIKPIFRDDFCCWGHIEAGGKKWKILPMYFIPHGNGIMGLTNPSTKYKFGAQPRLAMRMAAPATYTHPVKAGLVGDAPQGEAAAQTTDQAADGSDDAVVVGAADIAFDGPEAEAPADDPNAAATLQAEQDFLSQPIQDADFGADEAAAEAANKDAGGDW